MHALERPRQPARILFIDRIDDIFQQIRIDVGRLSGLGRLNGRFCHGASLPGLRGGGKNRIR